MICSCKKKIVCLIVCTATLFFSLCLPSAADGEGLCFYLEAHYHPELEMVTVELVCEGGEIAGAMLEIEYDGCLSFTSAESLFDGLEFSCSLSDVGTVRVLFDSPRNVYLKGSMALLSFSLTDSSAERASFGLRCLDKEDIYGVYGSEFYTVGAELYGCFLKIPHTEPDVEYLGFYDLGGGRLCFVGSGEGESSGFEVCAVDPMMGTVERYLLAADFSEELGQSPNGNFFTSDLTLPKGSSMLCVFVRAFEDKDNVRLYGKEEIHFFYKGIYTEYDEKLDRLLADRGKN